MAGPWEKYAAPSVPEGPWSKYSERDDSAIYPSPVPGNGSGGGGNGSNPSPVTPEPRRRQTTDESLASYTGKIRNGLTFGFGDELSAAAATPLNMAVNAIRGRDIGSFGDNYNQLIAADRQLSQDFSAEHPIIAAGSEIAGGIASGGALAKAAPSVFGLGTRGGQIAQGAKAGLTQGAVFGAGNAEGGLEERLQGAGTGAAIGAATGGALAPVANAIGGVARGIQGKAPTLRPAGQELRNMAQQSYQAADEAGVQFNPEKFKSFVTNAREQAVKEGLDSQLQPGTTRVLERLTQAAESGNPLTLTEVENLRRVSMGVNPTNPSDYRFSAQLRNQLDDFVEGADKSGAIDAGSPEGIQALRQGREQWRQLRKNEVIDDIFNREGATNQTIKQGMRSLVNNKKRFAQFNDNEKAAIRKAARTGAVEQTLRTIGQLDPTNNRIAGGFGIASTLYAPGGAALPAAGFAANRAAQGLASSSANAARHTVRNAGEAIPTGAERVGQRARSVFGLSDSVAPTNPSNPSGMVGGGSATMGQSIQPQQPTIQRSPKSVRLNSRPEASAAIGAATLPVLAGTGGVASMMGAQSSNNGGEPPRFPIPPMGNSQVNNPQDFNHDDFLDTLTNGVESNGERNAKNPKSSALGPYQIIRSTFAGLVKKYDPETYKKGNFQNLRTDPEYSRFIAKKYSEENLNKLVSEGLPISKTTAYLAYFADGKTAAKLLKSPANAPASSVFSSDAMNANPFLKGKTVGEVVQWANKKVNRS